MNKYIQFINIFFSPVSEASVCFPDAQRPHGPTLSICPCQPGLQGSPGEAGATRGTGGGVSPVGRLELTVKSELGGQAMPLLWAELRLYLAAPLTPSPPSEKDA